MKKSITILAFAFGITGAFAQDLTSKKGEPILPEAGDWAIGIDATPFLNYAGNFFGKTTNNNAPTFNFFTNILFFRMIQFIQCLHLFHCSIHSFI